MRVGLFGGLSLEHDGRAVTVTGQMQLAVLFRLIVDAGRSVSYREIVEDVWGLDAPENERAALQSVISRLRSQLPAGLIESTPGGYRLAITRDDVDALRFSDLVACGSSTEAMALWTGEPWVPSENFDWFERDLRRDRDALAVDPPAPSAIPMPLSEIIGRDDELAAIGAQLQRSRLVTILGPGGAGKTRLAVESARLAPGAVFVELAPVGGGEVLAAVLAATGRVIRSETSSTEPVGTRDRVLDALRGRRVVLVLDNCEHVVAEVASIAADLLAELGQLRVLATSREPLGVPGEAFVPIGPLALPGGDDAPGDFAAVQLFRERAISATGSDFTELDTAARICARLDGLPLAIELAAAKLRTMTTDEVLTGLEHRFALLTGGFRTALPRHQTLRAMIDWSWSLIGADERRALAWLAVYPAGIAALDAAEVADAFGLADASVFDSLVDRSLLQRVRGRYRALETIREYGIDRLGESDELTAARESQAQRMARAATRRDASMRGPAIHDAIDWFDAEADNIAAALRYSTAAPRPELAVDLVLACTWYWVIRNVEEDASTWFRAVAPLVHLVDTEEAALMGALLPLLTLIDGAAQEPDVETRRAFAATVGAVQYAGENEILQLVPPMLAAFAPMFEDQSWMLHVLVPQGEELGLAPWPTAALHVIGAAMAQNRGDVELLGAETDVAISQFEKIGDFWGLALAQQLRAEWLTLQGRLTEALAITDESTVNMRRITPSWDLAQQQGLGIQLLMRLGRHDEADARATEMVESAMRSGNSRTIVQAHQTAALVQVALGRADEARALLEPIVGILEEFTNFPPQTLALVESIRAGIAMLEHDLDGAESHLRVAAKEAIASHDQPIMGLVAINIGTLALRRDEVVRALEAVDIAAVLIGAHDATHPQVVEIERVAAERGIGRDSAASSRSALTRPKAIEELERLA